MNFTKRRFTKPKFEYANSVIESLRVFSSYLNKLVSALWWVQIASKKGLVMLRPNLIEPLVPMPEKEDDELVGIVLLIV